MITPKKVRIVYDGSAHAKGSNSLNQCLYRDPVLLPELVGLLMRFRATKYPILTDVEKAFLQVDLIESDREVTKFLWVKNPTQPLDSRNLQIFRFRRVPFGIISSPYLLAAVVQKHLDSYGDDVVAVEAKQNSYVDNVLLTAETADEATEKVQRARQIFLEAQMNLREFVCNIPDPLSVLPTELVVETRKPKVLGIKWLLDSDAITIPFLAEPVSPVTRRTVLASIAGVYDPLGLVSPATLLPRAVFQRQWNNNRPWDSPLPEDEEGEWRLLEELWLKHQITVPRRSPLDDGTQLHIFCDASSCAFACAVYARNHAQTGAASCHLLYAKSRLKPKKQPLTIPQLELMALLIATRAATFVQKELRIEPHHIYFWSNSQIVLHWLNSATK